VLVRCYEWFVTQLSLQIYTESFYSIAHWIGSLNSWKILQEFRGNSHLWRLLSIWIILLGILLAITVVICNALVVAQTASSLRLASISIATNLSKLIALPLSWAWAAVSRFFTSLTRLDHTSTVCLVTLRRSRHYLAFQILIVMLLRFLVCCCSWLLIIIITITILTLLKVISMLHSWKIVSRGLLLGAFARIRRLLPLATSRLLVLLTLAEGVLSYEITTFLILTICSKLLILPRYPL